MTGFDYFSKCLSKYAIFDGRASRKEYWYFVLFYSLMQLSLLLFGALNESEELIVILTSMFSITMFLPFLAVSVRRLHDIGQSGWLMLLSLLPPGWIALIILFCLKSQPHPNKWGPTPLTFEEDEWDEDDEILEDFEFRSKTSGRRNDYV